MPFVLTGNLETDTMCRFGMAESHQGGGAWASRFDLGSSGNLGSTTPIRQRRPAVSHVFTSR
jgi:hypothetical protein